MCLSNARTTGLRARIETIEDRIDYYRDEICKLEREHKELTELLREGEE